MILWECVASVFAICETRIRWIRVAPEPSFAPRELQSVLCFKKIKKEEMEKVFSGNRKRLKFVGIGNLSHPNVSDISKKMFNRARLDGVTKILDVSADPSVLKAMSCMTEVACFLTWRSST
jgi:hypothetical protein